MADVHFQDHIRLIVPEPNVEPRPEPLDEVVLEEEGILLAGGHQELEIVHPIDQMLHLDPAVGGAPEV
jgi:hypothetical protein